MAVWRNINDKPDKEKPKVGDIIQLTVNKGNQKTLTFGSKWEITHLWGNNMKLKIKKDKNV